MQNLRSILYALGAFAIVCSLALFTISATVILAGALAAVTIARSLTMQAKPVPVRARKAHEPRRVWNDGRGTIIDM